MLVSLRIDGDHVDQTTRGDDDMALSREPVSEEALTAHLAAHPDWSVVDGKLHRELRFADFIEAFGFMTRAALVAQSMDHHPEWSNVYGTVVIDLVTHSAGGITENDLDLSRALDALVDA
jgi:4a-hydroxytetrahydrobiopterin dehydratase